MREKKSFATVTCFATLVVVLSDRNDYLELDQPAKDPCKDNCLPLGGKCDFFPPLGKAGEDICDTCKVDEGACKPSDQTEAGIKELEKEEEEEEDGPDEEPESKKRKARSQPESADGSERDSESDFEKMVRICKQFGDRKKIKGKASHAELNELKLNPVPGWSCEAGAWCLDTRFQPAMARGVVTSKTQTACMAAFAPGVLGQKFQLINTCIPYKCIFVDGKAGICSLEDMKKEIVMLAKMNEKQPVPEQPVPLPQPEPVPPPATGEPGDEPPAPAEQPKVAPPVLPEQPKVEAEPQADRVAEVSAPPSPPAKSPVQVCEAILADKDTKVFCRKGTMKQSDWKKALVKSVTGFQQKPAGWTCTKAYKCGGSTVVKGNSAAACNGQPAELTCIPDWEP